MSAEPCTLKAKTPFSFSTARILPESLDSFCLVIALPLSHQDGPVFPTLTEEGFIKTGPPDLCDYLLRLYSGRDGVTSRT